MPQDLVVAPDAGRVFFQLLGNSQSIVSLFDLLPNVILFVKDTRHRFVRVNVAFVKHVGLNDPSEAIGKCDYHFHPPVMAEQYAAEDKRVMQSREPIIDAVWLVLGGDGMPGWYLCSKIPVTDALGSVIGLAGFLVPHDRANHPFGPYGRLSQVCDFVLKNYGSPITVVQMAEQVDISVSQLQREFGAHFGMSPRQYLSKVRLSMAQKALIHTDEPLSNIALSCGFYDQSHFNKVFRQATGQTPREYQSRFGR
jgi:AraC-like DNA-binding protein